MNPGVLKYGTQINADLQDFLIADLGYLNYYL